MCNLFGGGNSNKVSTTQTYTPNPQIAAAGSEALSGAQSASQLPFQMPAAPVAPFSPLQQQYFGQVQGGQGMALPYFDDAAQYMRGAASPISEQDVQQYYNPFAANVFANLQDVFGQQMKNTTGNLQQQAGGIGADRIAVAQANLAKQQGLAAGQTAASLYQPALQQAQQQKQMMAGTGFGLGQLAPAIQNSFFSGTGLLGQAGAQQQAQDQAQQNALYQQRLAQIAYPFQTPQYLAGITGSLAGPLGGTSNATTTYPAPSALSQILGIGTAAAGLYGSMGGFSGGGLGGLGGSGGITPYGISQAGPGMGTYYGGSFVPTAGINFRRGGRTFAEGGSTYGKLASNAFSNAKVGNPYADDSDSDDQNYADGGDTDAPPPMPGSAPLSSDNTSIVPKVSLPATSGHSDLYGHESVQHLKPPQGMGGSSSGTPSTGASGSGGNNTANEVMLGASMAMKLLPLLALDRGGPVNPFDHYQHFATGGESDFDMEPDVPWETGNAVPDVDVPYETAGARPKDPHFSAKDVVERAGEYYPEKAKQAAEFISREADPQNPMNVRNYLPQSAQIFNPPAQAAATPTPEPQNPMAPPDFSRFQREAMPQGNIGISTPAAKTPAAPAPSKFSPQMPPASPQQIAQETIYAANKYGVPPELALRLINRESGFRNIRGAAGEYGPAQLMPGTAKELGISDPSNTYVNIHGGMQYLRQMYDRYGNWNQAVAAYNAGPGNVDRGRIPASTRDYVADVNGNKSINVDDLSAKEHSSSGERNPFIIGNRDMKMETNPDRPYPDALSRDWGQNITRNPWMAVVRAGAEMAGSVGPIGSVIGKGIKAGANELENQRTALRSEQELNNKADALFQHYKEHLDKYQRMTPYEKSLSDFRQTKLESPTGATGWKYKAWLSANPGDEKGALEFAGGRRQVPEAQLRRWAADQAIKEKKDDPSVDIDKRTNELFRLYKEPSAGQEKPKPTQADLDYVKAHPETADRFKERFGVEPS